LKTDYDNEKNTKSPLFHSWGKVLNFIYRVPFYLKQNN